MAVHAYVKVIPIILHLEQVIIQLPDIPEENLHILRQTIIA